MGQTTAQQDKDLYYKFTRLVVVTFGNGKIFLENYPINAQYFLLMYKEVYSLLTFLFSLFKGGIC